MKGLLPVLTLALAIGGAALAAGPDKGWKSASPGRAIRLPEDHASHPDYRLEWWYYTGHLESDEGRRFGYQLTFFRVGVERNPANPSRWAVRDLHMAHLAITDVRSGRHAFAELLNRAGVGWAGAETDRYRVWNEDWSVERQGSSHLLRASTPEMAIDLVLSESRPVFHGENGFSQKGPTPGNASYYYSMTRMPTRGILRLGSQRLAVRGASWMDHEFGTSFLESSQQGWDWFSLQLDDGTDLMMFQLRDRSGRLDPHSSGTLVDPAGRVVRLDHDDFALQPRRTWRSPRTGAEYPIAWDVRVPSAQLTLRVEPLLDAQELTPEMSGVAYWEGAIAADGTRGGRPITGRGYLELTGYAGEPMGEVIGIPDP